MPTPWLQGDSIQLDLNADDFNTARVVAQAINDHSGSTVAEALDGRTVDYTVLNHYRGLLLPRDWPEAYNPIRGDAEYPNDTSEIQSDVVECWSQAWWGFQRGPAAAMIIIETPDDAAYQWSHPAGGPTVIGPRWRAQLGRLGYPRAGRMVFFEQGNYVDLARRYREHAIVNGLWVPLAAKIRNDYGGNRAVRRLTSIAASTVLPRGTPAGEGR